MVTVVGMGPGGIEHITPAARASIEAADMLIGSAPTLSVIDTTGKEVFEVTGQLDAALSLIRTTSDRNVAVLVTGDPGFYSLLQTIRAHMPDLDVAVIPGISSAQFLFGSIGESWHDVRFVSVHGRSLDEIDPALVGERKICVLTDTATTGSIVARYLLGLGVEGRAVVGVNLTRPNQQIIDTTVRELASMDGFASCVLYIAIER